jgi:glutamate/tyrosine decarboxylase-like PLP-dependent enzyme
MMEVVQFLMAVAVAVRALLWMHHQHMAGEINNKQLRALRSHHHCPRCLLLPRRSLKLFFVLRMYGEQQIQAYLRHHIALAQYFARLVQQDERFELAAPQRFGLVCFRLKGVGRQANAALLDEVNATGKAVWAVPATATGCRDGLF